MNQLPYEVAMATMTRECADDAQSLMRRAALGGDIQPLRLYYRPAQGESHGQLRMAPRGAAEPLGYQLACADLLTASVPYDGYQAWIRQRAGRLPVLGAA